MYDPVYVKKKKRRKIVAIVAGISTVVVTTFSIVAFLGRFVGTFTVSLDTGKVKLALSTHSNFRNQTSFLRVDELPAFNETTYSYLHTTIGDATIDNEDTDYKIGTATTYPNGSIKSLSFFKYTFYVKNVGKVPARYTFAINILDSKANEEGRTLDDTIRVMIYDNVESNDHSCKIYAKRSSQPTHFIDGEPRYESPIASADVNDPEFAGYAEMFRSNTVIAYYNVGRIGVGELRRYTVATWLEGYASDDHSEAPVGANMKLGVEINAYEV